MRKSAYLGDLGGLSRHRQLIMFVTGWAVLAVGSLVAGLASNPAAELVGRAVQCAGSALIAPAALALLMVLFALGPGADEGAPLYGAAAPAGRTAGVFHGGVLTQYATWPSLPASSGSGDIRVRRRPADA